MHCHDSGLKIEIPSDAKKIVLAGNPNVGKSVFFNALTGMYVDVSNYPGTTLEISHGKFGNDVVIDTPGVYGISSFNDEERIARDIILNADVVINIVDAVHLERDLFLTQQIIDTGVPVVVALNMLDEAERQGRKIDVDLLSDLLGVPVIPTVATEKIGLEELKKKICCARQGNIDHELQKQLNTLVDRVGSQGEALLILEGDPIIAERHGIAPGDKREKLYIKRRERVNDIVSHVVSESNKGASFSTILGRLMIRPWTGIPLLILALWGMYELIGVFIAGTVVGFTEETVMQGMYEPFIRGLVSKIFSEQSVIGTLLIGEFGVLTMTVTYILGLLLPLVVGFYLVLSAFEDSGYLPRIATLTDRILSGIGLNGRAVIPIILGFGCVTMATITTRLLGSDRERRIAIFLLAMAIPCSAQLAVVVSMLAGMPAAYVGVYVAAILTLLVTVGTIMNRVLPGRSSEFLIDLPPLRVPRLNNVVTKTVTKSYMFLKEATPLFALGALIIGILNVTGILRVLQGLLSPLTVGWLGLPKEAANAFIMGFVRRDFGAAGLASLDLSPSQTIVALITITIFVPCIASAMVIFKERGKKEAAITWITILGIAFFVGGIVNQLFKLFSGPKAFVSGGSIILVFLAVMAIVSVANKIIPSKTLET
ncbi:ferrous iron transport protein B [Thermincola ferriacetica]|uniref:Ferrous iron transport protein B n=1 Tax=Thermincola ferriacetica TaxID=281456 RepID=A0A0L6W744_9FIRM|nr:ferrous iron transport protein B [Thermincola ferriacetica]KNZ71203.1 ferrous iron transport protein B [Thermincola ferriacetica]